MTQLPKINNDILLEQYRRASEDWRHYDKMLWEIPFSTTTVVGAIIALMYGGLLSGQKGIITDDVRIILIVVLIEFVFTMILLTWKVRFFQEARTKFIESIERNHFNVGHLPVETQQGKKYVDKKFTNYRAIDFQFFTYAILELLLSYLLFHSIYSLLSELIIQGWLGLCTSIVLTTVPFVAMGFFITITKERSLQIEEQIKSKATPPKPS